MNKLSYTYTSRTVACIGISLFVLGIYSCTKQPSWKEEISTFVSLLFDGKFNEAAISGEKAVEIAKEEYGIHSIQVASTYTELGKLYYQHLHDNHKAYIYFDSSLVVQKYPGNKQTDLLPSTLNYLGLLKMKDRDFTSATEQYFLQAAKGAEVLLHETDTNNIALYTKVMFNLATYYEMVCNYEKATDTYKKVINIREYFNLKDPETLVLYANFARTAIEGKTPDYSSARDIAFGIKNLLEEAGDTKKRIYAESLGVLGEIHRKEGNYDSALYYQNQELQIYRKYNDSEGLVLTYYHLATTASDQKKFSIADSLFRKALSLQKQTNSDDVANRGQVMFSQGMNYVRWGRYVEARAVLTDVWEMYKDLYGEDNIQTKAVRREIDKIQVW